MDGWAAIFTGIIAGTGILALVYTAQQIRLSRESEKIRHLIEFLGQFESDPVLQYRKTTATKRLNGESNPNEAYRILDFFETVGLLVRREYLDEEDVWDGFSYWIFNIYADFREELDQIRKKDPSFYSDFYRLLDVCSKIERRKGADADKPSRDDIMQFWEDESEQQPGTPPRKRRAKRTSEKQKELGNG